MPDNPMPTNEAPDDIFALFSRFDLDMSQYRVFERDASLLRTDVVSAEAPIEITTETVVETLQETISLPRALETPRSVRFTRSEMERTPSRSALANLQRSLKSRDAMASGSSDASLALPLSVCGSAGGVGVTTVAATLARQLSKDGGKCGLYDASHESLLPLYFGNQQIATHHHRFAGLHSVLGASVRFLTPAMCEEQESVGSEPVGPCEQVFRNFGSEFDHIIFDSSQDQIRVAGSLKIYVAIPDVASVVGLQRLLGRMSGRKPAHEAICVLNRFDSALALHQELRCWYEDHFEEVITVDNSPLVSEALAEGVTVLDWAPEVDASADFVRLANAIRRAGQKVSAGVSISKTQPEGLALCS